MDEPPLEHEQISPEAEARFQEYLSRIESGDTPERSQFLEETDEAIRREVAGQLAFFDELSNRMRVSADIVPGMLVGDYRLVREIGRGASSVVWEAEQLALGRHVALKLLNPVLTFSGAALERFQREAQAAGRLEHPAIVPVFDTGESAGVLWIAQELIPNSVSLEQVLAKRRAKSASNSMSAADAVTRIAELARGVHELHEVGIVHRDIKPGNILISKTGAFRLADFGVALLADQTRLTRSFDMAGTPSYMSPEQISPKGTKATPASDLFALGVVLYELLTLRRPFPSEHLEQLQQEILKAEPLDPRKLVPSVPRDVAAICRHALAKEPSGRYPTAAAFAEDCERWLRREPVMARRGSLPGRASKWVLRNPLQTTIGVLLATIALLAITLLRAEHASLDALRGAFASSDALVELLDPDRSPESQQELRQVVKDYQERFHEHLPEPAHRIGHLLTIGRAYRFLEDHKAGLAALSEGLRLRDDLGGDPDSDLFDLLLESAWCATQMGEHADSAQHLDRLLAYGEAGIDPDAKRQLLAENRQIINQFEMSKVGQAHSPDMVAQEAAGFAAQMEELVRRIERQGLVGESVYLLSRLDLAILLSAAGRDEAALPVLSEVRELYVERYGRHHPEVTYTYIAELQAYTKLGRYEEALRTAREAESLREFLYGPDHPLTLECIDWIERSQSRLREQGHLSDK